MSTRVIVVDDDPAVRASLRMLLEGEGHDVEEYESAERFLEGFAPSGPTCLITDLKMPGASGLELQRALAERGIDVPIIMLTGHGDVPAAVQSMKYGALDFIQKPYQPDQLLSLVDQAIALSLERNDAQERRKDVLDRLATLTAREREVLFRVANGQSNKVIAIELEISERTVELHRARAMRKMGERTVAGLVKLITDYDVDDGPSEAV